MSEAIVCLGFLILAALALVCFIRPSKEDGRWTAVEVLLRRKLSDTIEEYDVTEEESHTKKRRVVTYVRERWYPGHEPSDWWREPGTERIQWGGDAERLTVMARIAEAREKADDDVINGTPLDPEGR